MSFVQNQIEIRLLTVDRPGEDIPELELPLVGPALDQPASLRELLRVQEIESPWCQFRFEKGVIDFEQGLRQEQVRRIEHLVPGLAVQRRIVGDP